MSKRRLGLRAGELVRVRSADEIRATLDARGSLDAMPFMPEMVPFCGREFRVYRRADKSCDTIHKTGSRRLRDTVHLEMARCDGAGHDGCQARCLIFWKEAWLERVPESADAPAAVAPSDELYTLVRRNAQSPAPAESAADGPVYRCQATQLFEASRPLPWWDFRQYLRELWTHNVPLEDFMVAMGVAFYNGIQRRRGKRQYPQVVPTWTGGPTPVRKLDLQPGELVRIRSADEIFATLDKRQKNRGLFFDREMIPYCGKLAVVDQRVDHIINEKTGRMMRFPSDCIMLKNVTCRGCLSPNRLLCPRTILAYWREIWLERVSPDSLPASVETTAAT